MNLFSKSEPEPTPEATPPPVPTGRLCGSLVVNRAGRVVATTLGGRLDEAALVQLGRTALHAFAAARRIRTPLSELVTFYGEDQIVSVELRGGAMVFVNPGLETPKISDATGPKSRTDLDDLILDLETYLECWKQFNHFLNLARQRTVTAGDEARFIEVKALLAAGWEPIMAAGEEGTPSREELLELVSAIPGVGLLVGHDKTITALENRWHRVYLALQALLGRLKVQQQRRLEGDWNVGAGAPGR